MKKQLPQIALNFPSDPEHPVAVPAVESMQTENVEQEGAVVHGELAANAEPVAIDVPAGVGVRLKSLKTESPMPSPAPADLSGHAIDTDNGANRDNVDIKQDGQSAGASAIKSKRGRKSLKQGTADADLIDIPDDERLFQKQYYTMGEVADMFRVNQSLLRFWETEFSILQPRKNKKGDRHFRPIDIKNLHLIYHLLRQRKYTIEGAKEFLKKNKKAEERFDAIRRLQQVRSFLLEWKAQL